jgi:hypothetical protein
MTPTQTTITITDRNETKFQFAMGFTGIPSPRNGNILDFEFEVSEELFESRRAYSLNHSVPVLSFISASRYVDQAIHDHRQRGGL